MSYYDLVAELTGTLPGLTAPLAEKYIQRAWKDVQKERRWGFLSVDASVVCPTMVTTGAANVTQYLNTVTMNAAASAALIALGSVPGLTAMQIRFGGSSTLTAGQIYRIMVADTITDPTAVVLTLDRPVVEPTNATSTYQCYRCYVKPPQANFKAWDSFVDMTYGFPLKLNWTSEQFDAVDPQRTSQGDAYYMGYFRTAGPYGMTPVTPDPTQARGAPIYELWPAPTSGRTFYARYRLDWQPFTDPDDELPEIVSDTLVMTRAQGWHAYPFAMANVGLFPGMKAANWLALIQIAKADYLLALREAKKNDDAQSLTTVWNRGHGLRGGMGLPFPADASFIQSHLLNF